MIDAAEELAERVDARMRGSREGLFGPGSLTWSVLRETALLFGGPRALLLQLAHPAIAAGIEQHSAIAADPLGRSLRTFGAIYALCFGDRESALRVVRAVRRRHEVVVGTTPRGAPYRAMDPDLLLWVYATLFDATVRMFEMFVRPLKGDELQRLYDEGKVMQIAFGIPPDRIIPSAIAFDDFTQRTIASDALVVSPHAIAQWEALVAQPPSKAIVGAFLLRERGALDRIGRIVDASPVRALTPPLLRLFAAGTLPPRIREAYGCRWTRADAMAFPVIVEGIRRVYARLPYALRFHPAYRAAKRRMKA